MGAGQTQLRGTLCMFDLVPDPDNAGVGEIFYIIPSRYNFGGFSFYEIQRICKEPFNLYHCGYC